MMRNSGVTGSAHFSRGLGGHSLARVYLGIAELVKSFLARFRRFQTLRRSRAECFDRAE